MFLNKVNEKLIENDHYNEVLAGILEVLATNKDDQEIKLFLQKVLEPWALKLIKLTEKKVNYFYY